ncbi:MAG: methyltransferase domain-containing protein, partial [Armatimonadetes bacterium]|nr:methyltransferase domain-containing protein [Armatimonadota bacterium]
MDPRTRTNMEWLDRRFRQGLAEGRYCAHEPIYGLGSPYSEPDQLLRLARSYSIMRRLSQIQFHSFLDVGGAEGYHADLTRRLFSAEVATTDLSLEANFRAGELYGIPGAASDARWLPFADRSFDVVLCTEVLEHVTDPIAVMWEVMRVAARYAIFTTDHVCRFRRERRLRLLLTDPESPHAELNWFLREDFAAALGEPVSLEPYFTFVPGLPPPGEEAGPAEARALIPLMTGSGRPLASGHGVLVIKSKDGVPPIDPSVAGGPALLDAILEHRLEPRRLLPSDPTSAIPPALADRLACPDCLRLLTVCDRSLACVICGERYPIERGVPALHKQDHPDRTPQPSAFRWPWLDEPADAVRQMFLAPRPAVSRLLCYLLDLELTLTEGSDIEDSAGPDYSDPAQLRAALSVPRLDRPPEAMPPESWWHCLPATEEEQAVMRSLGAAVADLAARGGVTEHRPPRSVGSLLGALRRRLRLGRARLLDVPAGFWAAKEIATLIRAGVIFWPADGLFHPDRAVCRGDLAVWLARALAGSDSALPTPSGRPTFIDVAVDDARYRSIEYAFARGVISGYADGAY